MPNVSVYMITQMTQMWKTLSNIFTIFHSSVTLNIERIKDIPLKIMVVKINKRKVFLCIFRWGYPTLTSRFRC